ncbi:hypothetical protein LINGRAHAP2_LOCUS36491, partial [Linum grandiflorum]
MNNIKPIRIIGMVLDTSLPYARLRYVCKFIQDSRHCVDLLRTCFAYDSASRICSIPNLERGATVFPMDTVSWLSVWNLPVLPQALIHPSTSGNFPTRLPCIQHRVMFRVRCPIIR